MSSLLAHLPLPSRGWGCRYFQLVFGLLTVAVFLGLAAHTVAGAAAACLACLLLGMSIGHRQLHGTDCTP